MTDVVENFLEPLRLVREDTGQLERGIVTVRVRIERQFDDAEQPVQERAVRVDALNLIERKRLLFLDPITVDDVYRLLIERIPEVEPAKELLQDIESKEEQNPDPQDDAERRLPVIVQDEQDDEWDGERLDDL